MARVGVHTTTISLMTDIRVFESSCLNSPQESTSGFSIALALLAQGGRMYPIRALHTIDVSKESVLCATNFATKPGISE